MLDNEIRYLWARRISLGSVLLFLCRYLPFASVSHIYFYISTSNLTYSNCIAGFRATTCIVCVEFILSTLVLYTRVYTIWGGSKNISCLLVFTFAGMIAGAFYSLYLFLKQTIPILLLRPNGCIHRAAHNDLWIALSILIFSESLSFGLLILKSVMHARAFENGNCIYSRRSILSLMVRDGVVYFACTLAITIANLIVIKRVTPYLRDFLFVIQGAIHNILCSRLFFHVRAAVNDPSAETNASWMTLSEPAFASIYLSDGGDPAETGTMIAMTKFGSEF